MVVLMFRPTQQQLRMISINHFEISLENLTTKIATQGFDKRPFSLLSTVSYTHPGSL
jgi:hypothetical protein